MPLECCDFFRRRSSDALALAWATLAWVTLGWATLAWATLAWVTLGWATLGRAVGDAGSCRWRWRGRRWVTALALALAWATALALALALALACTVSQQFVDLRFRSGQLHLYVENLVYDQLNAVGSDIVCHALQIDSVFLQCVVDAVASDALSRESYFAWAAESKAFFLAIEVDTNDARSFNGDISMGGVVDGDGGIDSFAELVGGALVETRRSTVSQQFCDTGQLGQRSGCILFICRLLNVAGELRVGILACALEGLFLDSGYEWTVGERPCGFWNDVSWCRVDRQG
jgi:hypothetical protein